MIKCLTAPLAGLLPETLLPGARSGARSGAGPIPARVRLLLPEGPDGPRDTAERLQIRLYDRGVRAMVETAPPAAFAARLAAGEHDLALVPVRLVSRDPTLGLAQVAFALGGFARAASVLERAAAAGAAGLPALAAALEEELACVPLHASGLRLATALRVQGLAPLPDGTSDLADAWILPVPPGPARSAP